MSTGKLKALTAEERFWAKVDKNGPTPIEHPEIGVCWLWTASRGSGGYGAFSLTHTEIIGSHRFSYQLVIGEIPKYKELDHICHNRACVNPLHLRLATRIENQRNQGLHSNNTSGHKGAYKAGGRWAAQLKVNGKLIYLGRFQTKEDASEAHLLALVKYHGEFANPGITKAIEYMENAS